MFQGKNSDWKSQRQMMVTAQLFRRGIRDKRILDAFLNVPRHEFIPEKHRYMAYEDHPVQIGYDQTISQPYMVASMTELLQLKGSERVLEIGTGSGYQTAILAELCSEVYTVERIGELSKYARSNISRLGYSNIYFLTGDGTKGWKRNAPYDSILVTAGAPYIPTALIEQLNSGGRMTIPVGSKYSQVLSLVIKKGNKEVVKQYYGCIFVPLIGEEGWKE